MTVMYDHLPYPESGSTLESAFVLYAMMKMRRGFQREAALATASVRDSKTQAIILKWLKEAHGILDQKEEEAHKAQMAQVLHRWTTAHPFSVSKVASPDDLRARQRGAEITRARQAEMDARRHGPAWGV